MLQNSWQQKISLKTCTKNLVAKISPETFYQKLLDPYYNMFSQGGTCTELHEYESVISVSLGACTSPIMYHSLKSENKE